MGRYLDALKKLRSDQGATPKNLINPPSPSILGLLGNPSPRFEENQVANEGDQGTGKAPHPRGIHLTELAVVATTCRPGSTLAEVLEGYPDATVAEPNPKRAKIRATSEQEAELRGLVRLAGAAYGFSPAERREALALALNDPDAALMSYRAMAAELGEEPGFDNRRYCDECLNLRRDVCTIAEPKSVLVPASRGYHPVRELPVRCAGYAPGPDDPDRRPGWKRWPSLVRKVECK